MLTELDTIHCMDCLEGMAMMESHSVDMILCDLPYGTTRNKWDSVITFEPLWSAYLRVAKPNAAIVLTASQPFTSTLVCSRLDLFRYSWVWDKVNRISGHLNANKQPLKVVEDICVFYREQPVYNPQKFKGKPYKATSKGRKSSNYGTQVDGVTTINTGSYFPRNLIAIPADERGTVGRIHPTQKPVALFEYLVQTYTHPGHLVLDNCMGSGTTAVACIQSGRRFVGFENNPEYYRICQERIYGT